MSQETIAIAVVGALLIYLNMVAAQENEKRLDRIIGLLANRKD